MYSKHSEVLLQRDWSWRAQNVAQNPDSERFYLRNTILPIACKNIFNLPENKYRRQPAAALFISDDLQRLYFRPHIC